MMFDGFIVEQYLGVVISDILSFLFKMKISYMVILGIMGLDIRGEKSRS